MTAPAVIAHPGKAGRHHLRDQRYALRDMLIPGQNEHQQGNQDSAAGNSQKAGRKPADFAHQQSAENVRWTHRR
jgi:hypothetical protein